MSSRLAPTSGHDETIQPPERECEILLSEARRGDADALATLHRHWEPDVRRVCHHWLPPDQVEDAVQETFAKVLRALPSFEGDKFGAWVRTIARHTALDLLRTCGREVALRLDDDLGESTLGQVPDDAVVAGEQAAAVRKVLGDLRPRDSQLLVERHVEGRSVRHMASAHQLTENSMKVAVHRARERFRNRWTYDVAALVPWPWLRRILSQFRGATAGVQGSMAVAAAAAVLMTTVLVLPATPGDGDAVEVQRGPAAHSPSVQTDHGARDEVGAEEVSELGGKLPAPLSEAAHAHEDAQAPSRPGPAVTHPDVEVPVTGSRLHQDEMSDSDYEYGAEVEVGGSRVWLKVESKDEPILEPVNERACEAASQAPHGYCKTSSP